LYPLVTSVMVVFKISNKINSLIICNLVIILEMYRLCICRLESRPRFSQCMNRMATVHGTCSTTYHNNLWWLVPTKVWSNTSGHPDNAFDKHISSLNKIDKNICLIPEYNFSFLLSYLTKMWNTTPIISLTFHSTSQITTEFRTKYFRMSETRQDRPCGLVIRVPGYISRGPGFDSRRYHIFWEVVGLERNPLSLVRITEELLEWKSSGSGSRKSRLTAVWIRCTDHATPSNNLFL
jgi:hypothetical protein